MYSKKVVITIFTFLFIVFGSQSAFACVCIDALTIKDHFLAADVVITGKIKEIKATKLKWNGELIPGQKVKVEIEKNFKGGKNKFITLSQLNTSCDLQFNERHKEKSFLFYLKQDKKTSEYSIVICGRTNGVKYAKNDLSWLNELPLSLKRTRISGTLKLYEEETERTFKNYLNGIKVTIYNDEYIFEKMTDANGMYEFWDIPIGKYKFKIYIPSDYIVESDATYGEFEYKKLKNGEDDYDNFQIVVEPNSDAVLDYGYIYKK